jgi:hypothetical protein
MMFSDRLLGAESAFKPDGHWDRTYYVARPSIEEFFYWGDGVTVFPEMLEDHVTDGRLRILMEYFAII